MAGCMQPLLEETDGETESAEDSPEPVETTEPDADDVDEGTDEDPDLLEREWEALD